MLVDVEPGDERDETSTWSDGPIVFWHPRAVTRPGLRNFLKLYVAATQSDTDPEWKCLYEQNTKGFKIALERYGVRFGRHLSKVDRKRVHTLLIDRKTGHVKVKPQPWAAYLWSRGETE